MLVPDLIANAATRFPGRPCMVGGDRRLTFAEVDARADRLADAFARRGLRRGDRVALLAGSELEHLEIQVAAQRAGAILVPLNFRLAVPELRAVLGDCEPELLICGGEYSEAAQELRVPQVLRLGAEYEDALATARPVGPPAPLHAQTPSAILYTSGTTGRAKGALTSNGTLWARVNLMCLELGMEPGDVFYFPIPMFHVSSAVAYAFAYRGATTILPRRFTPAGAVRDMRRAGVTHAVFVPTMISRLVEELAARPAALETLQLVLYGGSAIAPEVLRRAMPALGCRFLQGYGLTEALNASMLRADDHDADGRPSCWAPPGRTRRRMRCASSTSTAAMSRPARSARSSSAGPASWTATGTRRMRLRRSCATAGCTRATSATARRTGTCTSPIASRT